MFLNLFSQKMTEVKSSELPKTITKYIDDNVSGAKVLKAVKIENKGTVKYNVAIDHKNRKYVYVFDKNGKFLKKGDDVNAPSNKVIINKGSEKSKSPSQTDTIQKPTIKDGTSQENPLVQEIPPDLFRNQP